MHTQCDSDFAMFLFKSEINNTDTVWIMNWNIFVQEYGPEYYWHGVDHVLKVFFKGYVQDKKDTAWNVYSKSSVQKQCTRTFTHSTDGLENIAQE